MSSPERRMRTHRLLPPAATAHVCGRASTEVRMSLAEHLQASTEFSTHPADRKQSVKRLSCWSSGSAMQSQDKQRSIEHTANFGMLCRRRASMPGTATSLRQPPRHAEALKLLKHPRTMSFRAFMTTNLRDWRGSKPSTQQLEDLGSTGSCSCHALPTRTQAR